MIMSEEHASFEKEIELLGAVYNRFHRFEDLIGLGFEEKDFESIEGKSAFITFQNAHNRGLKEVSEVIFKKECGLKEEQADDIISRLYTVSEKNEDYKYYLQNMVGLKQDRMRKRIADRYLKEIEEEKDFTRKRELNDEFMRALMDVEQQFTGEDEKTLTEIAELAYTEEAVSKKPIPTGFSWIDEHTLGFWRGLPAIVSAESGNGKSTMLRNLSLRAALDKAYGGQGLNVLVISLEMTKELLTSQYLSLINDDEMNKWYNFNIPVEKINETRDEAKRLASAAPGLKIDDKPYTPEKLARKIRTSKGKYDIIFVDYFQALDIPEGKNDAGQYNRASKIITRAVKQTDCAVVLLSQITTGSGDKAKTEKDHMDGRLRYAKQLLNDTVFELRIWRDAPDEDEADFSNSENEINVAIKKNRNGEQEIKHRFPYIDKKGIIGSWRKIEVEAPEMAPEDYLNHEDWARGLKPQFLARQAIPCSHLTRPELKHAFGFNIPEDVYTPEDYEVGIREEMIDELTYYLEVPKETLTFGPIEQPNYIKEAFPEETEDEYEGYGEDIDDFLNNL